MKGKVFGAHRDAGESTRDAREEAEPSMSVLTFGTWSHQLGRGVEHWDVDLVAM